MARLTMHERHALPKSDFGLPEKGKGHHGSSPMPDRKHAAIAKAYASRFASPSEEARIDAKADRILGTGHHGTRSHATPHAHMRHLGGKG